MTITYSSLEYAKHYGTPVQKDIMCKWSWAGTHCRCVRTVFRGVPTPWEDCSNCLGLGWPPIPWRDVK